MSGLERLRNREPVFGLFQTFTDPAFTELAVWCGYDFIIIDCEHGVADEAAQLSVLRTLEGSPTFALVRTRAGDESAVARYLDFGAHGVLVPDVRTAQHAKQIGFAARSRWTGGLRGDHYGLDQTDLSRRYPLVVVLIETAEGVGNVEAILDSPGIDGVIVGTGDLSTDLGAQGEFTSPAYLAAVEKVESAARKRNKILGSKLEQNATLSAALARGHRLIIVGRDTGLIRDALVARLKAVTQDACSAESGEH